MDKKLFAKFVILVKAELNILKFDGKLAKFEIVVNIEETRLEIRYRSKRLLFFLSLGIDGSNKFLRG